MDYSYLNIGHKSSCFDEEWLMLLRDALSALKVALEKINYLKQYITNKLNSEKSSMICEIKKERVQEPPENYFSPAALSQLYRAECERLARLEQSSRKSLSSTRKKQKEKIVINLSNSSPTNEPCSESRKRKKNSPVKSLKKGKSKSDKELSSINMAIDSLCLDDSDNNSTVGEVLNSQVQQDNLTPKSNFPSKQIPQEHSNLSNPKGGEVCGDDENPSIRTIVKDGNLSDPSFSDFSFTENQTSMLFDSALKEAHYKVTFKIKNNSISDFEIKEALERKGFSNFVVFVRNKQTRSRGFITFKDEETMKAVETCSDLYIHGQPLKIRTCNETLVTNDSKSNSSSIPGKIQLKVKPIQELSEVVLDQDCQLNNMPLEAIQQNYEDNCASSVPSKVDNNNIFIKKDDGCHLTESSTTNETVKSLTLLSTHIEDAITAITEDSNQEQLLQKLSFKKPKKHRKNIKIIKEDPSISSTPQLKTSSATDHNADITPDVKPILKSSLLEENVVDLSQNDVSSEILSLNVKNSTDVSAGIFPDSRDFVSKEISTESKQTCSLNVNQGHNDNNISKGNNPVKEIDESLLINVSCGYPSMRKSFSPGRVRRNSLKSPVPSNYTYESDRESNAASLGGKSFEALSVHSEPNFSVMTQENDCDAFDRYSESNLNFSSKRDVVQEDDQAYTKCFNFVNQYSEDIISIIKPFIEPCSSVLDGSVNEPCKNKCHEYHIVKKDTLDPKQDYLGMKSSCNVVSGCISADGDTYSSADNKDAYSSINNTDTFNSSNNTGAFNSGNNTDAFNSANNTDAFNSANNTDAFNSANNTDFFNSANYTDFFNSANNTDAFNSANNTDAFNSANNTDTFNNANYTDFFNSANYTDFFNSANNTDTYSISNYDYLNNKPYPSSNSSRKPGDQSSNKPHPSSNSSRKPGRQSNNKPYPSNNSSRKQGDQSNNKSYSSSNFSGKSTPRSKSYNLRYTPYKQKQNNNNYAPTNWHVPPSHFNKGNNSSNCHNQPSQFSKSSWRGSRSNKGPNRRNSQNSRNMNHQQRNNVSRKSL